jgi:hypothetical protein
MIQVENEIAVFGADRHNPKLWRDHSPSSNQRFADNHFKDDLKYSAWDLSYNWIRHITNAGAAEYPIPFFHNYVGGKVAEWMVGGAPGEDVETYLTNCPHISFIGVNSYFCAEWRPDNSCAKESQATVDELREPLLRYRVTRNVPAITEVNSGNTSLTSRLAFIALGEFGAPIYAPWALTVSYPEPNQPYILPDGREANGAQALRETYSALSKALPLVSYYAGTNKMKVFMSESPGQFFRKTADVNGFSVTVSGTDDGQAIVIHPAGHEFLILGYRSEISLKSPAFAWPTLKTVRVERVLWKGNHWKNEGEPSYNLNESHTVLSVDLDFAQAIHVNW